MPSPRPIRLAKMKEKARVVSMTACAVKTCGRSRFGVGQFCQRHWFASARYGHPKGRRISWPTIWPYYKLARRWLRTEVPPYRLNPTLKAVTEMLDPERAGDSLLKEVLQWWHSDASYRCLDLKLGASPRTVLTLLLATEALSQEQEATLPGDKRLDFAMADLVLRLRRRHPQQDTSTRHRNLLAQRIRGHGVLMQFVQAEASKLLAWRMSQEAKKQPAPRPRTLLREIVTTQKVNPAYGYVRILNTVTRIIDAETGGEVLDASDRELQTIETVRRTIEIRPKERDSQAAGVALIRKFNAGRW